MTDIPLNEDGSRKETPAETLDRLRKKHHKDPPEHFLKETDPELNEAPPSQEELFRQAAIECSDLETEIAEAASKIPWGQMERPLNGVFFIRNIDHFQLQLLDSNVAGFDNGPILVELRYGLPDIFERKHLGLQTDMRTDNELTIWTHGDEKTYEAYREYLSRERDDLSAITTYYFNDEGESMKTLNIPKEVPIENVSPFNIGPFRKHYQMDMNPSDFEMAKAALLMFKGRLEPFVVSKDKKGD